jgi:Ca-activated chloride channel family protein
MRLRTDRTLILAGAVSTRHAVVDILAPVAERQLKRPPVDVAIVLDRSGSMGGEKIRLAKQAAERALRLLAPTDRLALVVYDERIDVVVESVAATPEAVNNAIRQLAKIDARGSTNLAEGWLRGCEQVAAHQTPDALARCLLLTDGLANVGITSHDELVAHARELRQRGIVTSTFGVGSDFDEPLLQAMAQEGAGHFYYIEQAVQIPDFLASELGETLEVVARDVRLDVGGAAGAQVELLSLFTAGSMPQGLSCDLGDLVSGQEVQLVFAVTFQPGAVGHEVALDFRLRDRDGRLGEASGRLAWTRASHEANESQARDREVARAVAEVEAARGRREALEANRAGDFQKARLILHKLAKRLRGEGGDDEKVRLLADELEGQEEDFADLMSAVEMKSVHFGTYARLSSRSAKGASRRRT